MGYQTLLGNKVVITRLLPSQPHLDGGCVRLQTDDLADEALCSHADELVHGRASHILRHDHGS
jgi:hypothetical protein